VTDDHSKQRFEVRARRAEDIPAVRVFLSDFGQLSAVAIGVLRHEDLVFWIATEASAIVAAILPRPLPFADGTTRGGVDELLVAPQRRNRGVGRKLMKLAEAHYRRMGALGMSLVVVEDNTPALSLY
jgi:ribosomal protein S18 acetylase RimI-like enzyme